LTYPHQYQHSGQILDQLSGLSQGANQSNGWNRDRLKPQSTRSAAAPPKVAEISRFKPTPPASQENRFYQRLAGMVVAALSSGNANQTIEVNKYWLGDRPKYRK
jgi:hypothetical protein